LKFSNRPHKKLFQQRGEEVLKAKEISLSSITLNSIYLSRTHQKPLEYCRHKIILNNQIWMMQIFSKAEFKIIFVRAALVAKNRT